MVGLDLRSLALFRIALGLVLFLDWANRALHFRAHYTSEGILPLSSWLADPNISARLWSVFYLSDSPWFVALLFLLALAASGALTLGYRTWWSGWVSWVLLISLHHRNPMVLHLGDTYLLLLLFWGNFLPWGRLFSLDGRDELQRPEQPYVAVPGACYLLQVCLLYWFTALLRTGPPWQVDGSALYLAFQLESLLKEPAYWMLGTGPHWLAFFTRSALWLELFGPFLLLVPHPWIRVLAVSLIGSFHLGIYLTMDLLNFAWIGMMGPLGLLPAMVWEREPGRTAQRWLEAVWCRLRSLEPESLRPSPPQQPVAPWTRKFAGPALAGIAMLVSVFYLWTDFQGVQGARTRAAHEVIRAVGLNQRWGMFSPSPPSVFGWQSAEAVLRSGRVLDLVTEQPYPEGSYRGQTSWADQRWAEYRVMLMLNRFGAHAQGYLGYLARRWNHEHPDDPVVSAEYLWHYRVTQPDDLLPREWREVMARYRP